MTKGIAALSLIALAVLSMLGNFWFTLGIWPRSWGSFVLFALISVVLNQAIAAVAKDKLMPHTQLGIPFAAGSHTSYKAAEAAAPKRGYVTARYLAELRWAGKRGLIDAEAAQLLNRPVSSICSIRNGCAHAGLVKKAGEREGPWGVKQQIWQHVDV